MSNWRKASASDNGSQRSLRAAAYVRMSTEHQQYSTQNQRDAIFAFAETRGFEIVKTYADDGRSGLNIEGRQALTALIRDVESGTADFSVILVYDVSRWGRFQDPDESAAYEIRCKRMGVPVLYCAEQFENDGSPISNIIKSIKRGMAGEFCRELGIKVFAGQSRLIHHGYRQGGPAGYGLRRVLVDESGAEKMPLERGERKSLQTDRVILKLGPPEEVAVVRGIYRDFVELGYTESEIAKALNARGLTTDRGVPWSRGTVHEILINEKYVGHNVWNRRSFKLKQKHVTNPPAEWIRTDGAFQPVVKQLMFDAARQIILSRSYRMTDDEMLAVLKPLLDRHGYLSGLLINEDAACPSSTAYAGRFGSLLRTYSLVGYTPDRNYEYIEANRRLRERHPDVLESAIEAIKETGAEIQRDPLTDLLTINGEFTVSLVLCRFQATSAGSGRWLVRFDTGHNPDITIAVRMEPDARSIRDYFLLPAIDVFSERVRLSEYNDHDFETYRFDDLSTLSQLSRRAPIRGAGSTYGGHQHG